MVTQPPAAALDQRARGLRPPRAATLIEIDKDQASWWCATASGQGPSTHRPGPKAVHLQGARPLADTPPGHFSVAWAVDGIRARRRSVSSYRPRYFHPDGDRGPRVQLRASVPRLARLRPGEQRGHRPHLGGRPHADRLGGLGALIPEVSWTEDPALPPRAGGPRRATSTRDNGGRACHGWSGDDPFRQRWWSRRSACLVAGMVRPLPGRPVRRSCVRSWHPPRPCRAGRRLLGGSPGRTGSLLRRDGQRDRHRADARW